MNWLDIRELVMSAGGTHDVRLERTIQAPVARLWAAWTEPGGTSLVTMRGPEEFGMPDMHNTWTYMVVDPTDRLEFINRFAAADGHSIGPAEAGIPVDGIPAEVPHVLSFESLDQQTSRIRVVERGYTEPAARDMSAAGLEQCLDKMEALLSGDRTTR